MTVYIYKAYDLAGKISSGKIEAENEHAVAEYLRLRKFFIVEIIPQKTTEMQISLPQLGRTVTANDLAVFSRQFAALINAGVPILTCLDILKKQSNNKLFKTVLADIINHLESGRSMSDSFRSFPKVFPEIFVNMIETGETGGVLEPVLEQLSIHFEREHEIYEKVKSGMTYPLVIMIIAICAISFMLTFILPKFVGIILDTGAVLPLPTKMVLALSDILRGFWWAFLLAIGCGSIVFIKIMELPSWRKSLDYLFLKTPIFGKIVQKMIAARFARSLSIMMKCGVPIIEALNTLERTIGNLVIANAVANARQNIVLGKGISQPLAATGVFPLMVVQMISVGEETGTLGILLEKVAIFYDREVDYTLSRLSTLVEPVMIVGLGIVLGFIIIAIMMPMFAIVTATPM